MEWRNTLSPDQTVLIAGPTASGKSALALTIAMQQGGVIVNADALQIYECWQVLTARPSAQDMALAPHCLYGHITRNTPYSVGHWLREVAKLLKGNRRLIIVGGTGLYFTALTEGLADIPPVPDNIRQEANHLRETDPARMIAELDAPTRRKTDLHNMVRVQRAWEVLAATGHGLAFWQAQTPPPLLNTPYAAFVVMPEVSRLNSRIDRRFDLMMEQGALEEVKAQLPYWDSTKPWARAIGASQLMGHLHGKQPLDQAISDAKTASRQYAKRQRSWFRNRMKTWNHIAT